DGTLREVAEANHIPVITYEAGEALRFEESCIRPGVRGIINVMRHLQMLPPSKKHAVAIEPAVARSSLWVRAEHDGVFRPMVALAHVRNPLTLKARIPSSASK